MPFGVGGSNAAAAEMLQSPKEKKNIGDRVVISGTGEKNGKIGIVISAANSAGRYGVRLEDSGYIISLPIGNLLQISEPILSTFQLQFLDIPVACISRIIGTKGSVINVMTEKFKTSFQQPGKISPHINGHLVYLFIFSFILQYIIISLRSSI